MFEYRLRHLIYDLHDEDLDTLISEKQRKQIADILFPAVEAKPVEKENTDWTLTVAVKPDRKSKALKDQTVHDFKPGDVVRFDPEHHYKPWAGTIGTVVGIQGDFVRVKPRPGSTFPASFSEWSGKPKPEGNWLPKGLQHTDIPARKMKDKKDHTSRDFEVGDKVKHDLIGLKTVTSVDHIRNLIGLNHGDDSEDYPGWYPNFCEHVLE